MATTRRDRAVMAAAIGAFVIAAAVMAVLGGLAATSERDRPPSARGSSGAAERMCEEFIGRSLKAPATASYTHLDASDSATTWTVTGYVDSENAFGAMLRSDYVCEVRNVDGDEWKLVDLDLTR